MSDYRAGLPPQQHVQDDWTPDAGVEQHSLGTCRGSLFIGDASLHTRPHWYCVCGASLDSCWSVSEHVLVYALNLYRCPVICQVSYKALPCMFGLHCRYCHRNGQLSIHKSQLRPAHFETISAEPQHNWTEPDPRPNQEQVYCLSIHGNRDM